jgi:hypothetical protein
MVHDSRRTEEKQLFPYYRPDGADLPSVSSLRSVAIRAIVIPDNN